MKKLKNAYKTCKQTILSLPSQTALLIQVILAISLLYTGLQIAQFTTELAEFRRTFIVDLDLARSDFLSELNFTYMEACKTGINYPPEYRKAVPGFNLNSPVNWCYEKRDKWQEHFHRAVMQLGKPREH